MLSAIMVLWRRSADLGACCRFLAGAGAHAIRPLRRIHAAACQLDAAGRERLSVHPWVAAVLNDPELHLAGDRTAAARTGNRQRQIIPWGIKRIGAPAAWAHSRGHGVKVAVIDTGVDLEHANLRPNLRGGINLVRPGRLPTDDNGHGTHLA